MVILKWSVVLNSILAHLVINQMYIIKLDTWLLHPVHGGRDPEPTVVLSTRKFKLVFSDCIFFSYNIVFSIINVKTITKWNKPSPMTKKETDPGSNITIIRSKNIYIK